MPLRAHGPEPCASAYSATRAYLLGISALLILARLPRSNCPDGKRAMLPGRPAEGIGADQYQLYDTECAQAAEGFP